MEMPARNCYQSTMNDLERDIHRALVELEEKIASMRTANPKPDLLPIFTRIE